MKKRSWTEQQLKDAVKNSYSYRSVLNKLGLREAGGEDGAADNQAQCVGAVPQGRD